jgi:hypothetical protein
MDDKKKDPFGHPGEPLSASVRPHHKKIVPVDLSNSKSSNRTSSSSHALPVLQSRALDHDFLSFMTFTPQMGLIPDIPDKLSDSWYSGQLFCSLTDSIFDKSTPIKHSNVLGQVWLDRAAVKGQLPNISLEDFAVEDQITRNLYLQHISPIMVLTTDGGADHNIKFIQTQAALLALVSMFELSVAIQQ